SVEPSQSSGAGLEHRSSPSGKQSLDLARNDAARSPPKEAMGIIDDTRVSFAEFADEWLAKVKPRLRPRTAAHWEEIVEKQLKPAFTGTLRSVTVAQVEAYAAKRLEEGAAASTVNNALGVLQHIYRR